MIRDIIYYKALKYCQEYRLKKILHAGWKNFQADPEIASLLKTIECYLPKIDVLIDVGAHKGLFARAFHFIFRPDKTYCIEPNDELISEIKKNNDFYDLEIFQVGVAKEEGYFSYFKHQDSSMNSLVESNKNTLLVKFPYDDPEKLVETKVQVSTLDKLLTDKLEAGDNVFMKIDTQGNELEVLKGAGNVLRTVSGCLVEHMFVDAYKTKYDFRDLLSFMIENGFQLVGVPAFSKRPSYEISSVDFLFINNRFMVSER